MKSLFACRLMVCYRWKINLPIITTQCICGYIDLDNHSWPTFGGNRSLP